MIRYVLRTSVVAIMTASMAAIATVGWAQTEASAGYDLFTTDPSTTDLLGIPFVGDAGARPTFDFVAPPDSADGRRAIGDTDTIVHRLENAAVETVPGTAEPIAIEVVLLRLVSTIEFDVDNDGTQDGFVYVTLQKDRDPAGEVRLNYDVPPPAEGEPPPPPGPIEEDVLPGLRSFGTMTITFASEAGGTFDSQLGIYADLRLGAPDGPIVCGENAGLPPCSDFDTALSLESIGSAWGRNALPESITIRGVNFSLAAPDRNTPVDASRDFWAGVNPETSTTVCVEHGGHPDPGGLPTAHGTCRTSCTTDPITPASCKNNKDDDCNGTIDDCDEDVFGPIVQAPDAPPPFECPQVEEDLGPSVTGFATATDNCFPPVLPAGNITYADFRTDGCGRTFMLDRVWTATDDCGNDAAMPDLQQIHVVDTTDPEIDCPDDATILWTDDRSPDSLDFAEGSDTCSEEKDVVISWDDDSELGVCLSEEITRTWTATDDCGNGTDCDQLIHVRGPRDAITDLRDDVLALGLPKGTENALLATLNAAETKVCGGDSTAVNQLGAFINQVQAQSGKKIDPAAADELIAAAQAIIDAINVGGTCPEGC